MARAKKAESSSKTPSPALDAHIAACWTLALAPYFAILDARRHSLLTNGRRINRTSSPSPLWRPSSYTAVALLSNHWLNTWPDTFERLEREHATRLRLGRAEVPPSAVRDRLNPLHAALEPSLFEDDPDKPGGDAGDGAGAVGPPLRRDNEAHAGRDGEGSVAARAVTGCGAPG